MKQRLGFLVIVTVLVLFAGCVGGTGGSDTGGESDEGPRDVTVIEDRGAVLSDAGGYTATWEMKFATESAVVSETSYTDAVDYENERTSFSMLIRGEDAVANSYEQFYSDGSSYTKYGEGEAATYQMTEGAFAPENTLFPVESYLGSGSNLAEFSAVGTETYDGVTVTRYERTDQPSWVAAQGTGTEFTWTEFTYVVLIDADGLIRYESWGGTGVDSDDVGYTMAFSYSLTAVGSTVIEDPDWLGTAEEQADR